MEVKVLKRDGSIEDFSQAKIARVVHAAGLDKSQAEDLAVKVSSWVKKTNKDKVSSLEIRDQVLENLRKVNTNAANLFEWYEKTKEKGRQASG